MGRPALDHVCEAGGKRVGRTGAERPLLGARLPGAFVAVWKEGVDHVEVGRPRDLDDELGPLRVGERQERGNERRVLALARRHRRSMPDEETQQADGLLRVRRHPHDAGAHSIGAREKTLGRACARVGVRQRPRLDHGFGESATRRARLLARAGLVVGHRLEPVSRGGVVVGRFRRRR